MARIMTVDDSRLVRSIITASLGEAGYETVEAENGKEAMELLEQLDKEDAQIDLMFLDVNMPEMGGLEVVEQVKNDTRYEDVIILMVTTMNEMETVIDAINLGVSGYIKKPFKESSIVEALGKVL